MGAFSDSLLQELMAQYGNQLNDMIPQNAYEAKMNQIPRSNVINRVAKDYELHQYQPPMDDVLLSKEPTIRDQEYLEHSSLWGHRYMQGGAGEGYQRLKPDGSVKNYQVVKTDAVLPAYCNPPNPCPIGYTEDDGCLEVFENTAAYSREYQSSQQCMCDNEHMFECPGNTDENELDAIARSIQNNGISESNIDKLMDKLEPEDHKVVAKKFFKSKKSQPTYYWKGEKLPVVAKKSPHTANFIAAVGIKSDIIDEILTIDILANYSKLGSVSVDDKSFSESRLSLLFGTNSDDMIPKTTTELKYTAYKCGIRFSSSESNKTLETYRIVTFDSESTTSPIDLGAANLLDGNLIHCSWQLEKENTIWPKHYSLKDVNLVNNKPIVKLERNIEQKELFAVQLPIYNYRYLYAHCETSQFAASKYCLGVDKKYRISKDCVSSVEQMCDILLIFERNRKNDNLFDLSVHFLNPVRLIIIKLSLDREKGDDFTLLCGEWQTKQEKREGAFVLYLFENGTRKEIANDRVSRGYNKNKFDEMRCLWTFESKPIYNEDDITFTPLIAFFPYYITIRKGSEIITTEDSVFLPGYNSIANADDYILCRKSNCIGFTTFWRRSICLETFSCRVLLIFESTENFVTFEMIGLMPNDSYISFGILSSFDSARLYEGLTFDCIYQNKNVTLRHFWVNKENKDQVTSVDGLLLLNASYHRGKLRCKWSQYYFLAVTLENGLKFEIDLATISYYSFEYGKMVRNEQETLEILR
ncbi:neuroendocrine protein 7B2 precursor-like protein [Dinothrombium tinctorium]|uniref:Neuroendocrine protein 7B2 n=1 Tax=Dinothrombium tinctorium TaxID=1965070 RepID=A0A3S3P858_9ACAR|nr:neuroendocrine protein 7B2 precursor-like protein [Dinothrombium tinctorium]RWS10804.1 neuroendocrine protein 7B2 precursor-like protein [Dinothrombium tinctorium]RWS17016.1 neuroendocrine protein 7B2 precursor-like protein [Dinothrombium tinctorium]